MKECCVLEKEKRVNGDKQRAKGVFIKYLRESIKFKQQFLQS